MRRSTEKLGLKTKPFWYGTSIPDIVNPTLPMVFYFLFFECRHYACWCSYYAHTKKYGDKFFLKLWGQILLEIMGILDGNIA